MPPGYTPQQGPRAPRSAPFGDPRYPTPPQAPYGGYPPAPAPKRPGLPAPLVWGFFIFLLLGTLYQAVIPALQEANVPEPNVGPVPTTYQNEDYSPPPIDMNPNDVLVPDTWDQAVEWTESNAIYSATVPAPVRCTMSRQAIETMSPDQLQAYLNDLTGCLMKVFDAPMKDSGFELVRTPVYVYSDTIKSACGVMESYNAAYCAADQHIYFATNVMKISDVQGPFQAEMILAHEFAHSIQGRTGILVSSAGIQAALQEDGQDSEASLVSRMTEVQADCWAGEFINSVGPSNEMTQSELNSLRSFVASTGDDALTGDATIEGDHGRSKTRREWFDRGLTSTDMGTCNSYVAPRSQLK